jgi:hypothetical protein
MLFRFDCFPQQAIICDMTGIQIEPENTECLGSEETGLPERKPRYHNIDKGVDRLPQYHELMQVIDRRRMSHRP